MVPGNIHTPRLKGLEFQKIKSKKMYEAQLEFPEERGSPRKIPSKGGRCGYFLDLHNRAFLYSKNTTNVQKFPPQPYSGTIVYTEVGCRKGMLTWTLKCWLDINYIQLKIFRGIMPPDPPRTLAPAVHAKNAFDILFSSPNRKNATSNGQKNCVYRCKHV